MFCRFVSIRGSYFPNHKLTTTNPHETTRNACTEICQRVRYPTGRWTFSVSFRHHCRSLPRGNRSGLPRRRLFLRGFRAACIRRSNSVRLSVESCRARCRDKHRNRYMKVDVVSPVMFSLTFSRVGIEFLKSFPLSLSFEL